MQLNYLRAALTQIVIAYHRRRRRRRRQLHLHRFRPSSIEVGWLVVRRLSGTEFTVIGCERRYDFRNPIMDQSNCIRIH